MLEIVIVPPRFFFMLALLLLDYRLFSHFMNEKTSILRLILSFDDQIDPIRISQMQAAVCF